MSYYDKIYALVAQIPRGKVATYGQIALMTGNPRAARVVGYALRACHVGELPCHRVLRADGGTTCAFGSGVQRTLLEGEGVPFTTDGRADLSRCRWNGLTGEDTEE